MKNKVVSILVIIVFLVFAVCVFVFKAANKEEVKSNYEVITDAEIINSLNIKSSYEIKYEVKEVDGEYYIVVHYGEQPNYYNSLDVAKVNITSSKITIEVSLPKGQGMGDALSYPYAVIKVFKKPNKIVVKYK